MKKILSSILAFASLAIFSTGCLKDDGFEDQKYGTQITESKAVAFPQASSSPVVYGIVSQSGSQTLAGPTIAFEADGKAPQNITVTLALNNSLVAAAGLEVLPLSAYTIPGLTVTIPAGEQFGKFNITIPNSSTLDPQKSYGIGFTIAAVDGGYNIAANQKNVVIAFTIKNKYDGIYSLKGYVNMGPTNTTAPYLVNVPCGNALEIEMATISSTKIEMSHQPVFRGGSIIYFTGLFPIEITFDPATDKVTNVRNLGTSNGTYPYVFPDATDPSYNSRYDAATKTIYMRYRINNSGTWWAIDTLTYCRSR